MPKIKTLEDYKNANKKYCKTYYGKKKTNLENLKQENINLKQENINLKQINDNLKQENDLLIKELADIKDMLGNDTDEDEDEARTKQDEFESILNHLFKFIKKYSNDNYNLKKHTIKTRKLYFDN